MPTITTLPSPPSTSDPANFSSKADAHILALQTFTTEVNAFGASLAGAGIITPTRDSFAVNATTTDLWNHSIVQDWTGTATITNFPAAPSAGSQRVAYPAAGTIITNNANISVQGNATYTVAAGDELTITAITTTTFYVTIQRKDGKSVIAFTPDYKRRLAQVVNSQVGTVATGTTLIPFDNTIPQNTEGDQYMSLAITPINAASTLEIDVIAFVSSNITTPETMALFQDSTANALASAYGDVYSATARVELAIKHVMTAGTTSATTFKVRVGGNAANTTTFNGFSGGQVLGGTTASRITIKEYLP